MLWALAKLLSAEYKYNGDCTTLIIPPEGSGRMICVVREVGDVKKVESIDVVISLNLLIKNFALGHGAGGIAPYCLIIGIKTMPKDVYFMAIVPGLTHSCEGTPGRLYFCRDKGGCTTM
jgi:hypothetical protein